MARRVLDLGRLLRLLVVLAVLLLAGAVAHSYWQNHTGAKPLPLEAATGDREAAQQAVAQASLDALRQRDDVIKKQAVELEKAQSRVEVMTVEIAQLETGLAERDKMIDWLERALEVRGGELEAAWRLIGDIDPVSDDPPEDNDPVGDVSPEDNGEIAAGPDVQVEPDAAQTDVAEPVAETLAKARSDGAVGLAKAQSDGAVALMFRDIGVDVSNLNAFDGIIAYQEGNYQLAGAIWHGLAEQGDPRAQFHLGGMIAEGRVAPPDPHTALVWLERAKAGGYGPSDNLLAEVNSQIDQQALGDLKSVDP